MRSDWGSAREKRKGVWEVRYTADTHDGTGYRQHSETVRGTRRQANDLLARRRLELSDSAPVPTVGEAWRTWALPEFERRLGDGALAQRTFDGYLRVWEKRIAPFAGARRPSDIRPLEVQEWIGSMCRSQALTALTVLKRIMHWYRFYEVDVRDPFSKSYTLPSQERRSRDTYAFEQAAAVARELEGTRTWAAFVLCAFAGCRPGEAKGAAIADCSRIEVSGETVCAVGIHAEADENGRVEERVKTAESARVAYLPSPYAERMLAHAESALTRGERYLSDRRDGRAIDHNIVRRDMKAACAAAGVERLGLNSLRPAWRTQCQTRLGVERDLLEVAMGHVLPGVTGKHYFRPSEESIAGAIIAGWRGFLSSDESRELRDVLGY